MEGSFDLGSIVAHVKADITNFKEGMSQVQEHVGGVGLSFAGMAAAVAVGQFALQSVETVVHDLVGYFEDAINSAFEYTVQIRKLKDATGDSVEEITGFVAVLGYYDIGISQASFALKTFSRQIIETRDATDTTSTGFTMLGISVKDASGQLIGTNELLLRVADRFSTMADGAEKAAIAQKLFGRSGLDMIPMLDQGREKILEVELEAKKYGLVLDDLNYNKLLAAEEAHKKLDLALGGLKLQIATALMPTITDLINNHILPWIDANGGVQKIVEDKVIPVLKKFKEFLEAVIGKIGEAIQWYEQHKQTIKNTFDTIEGVIKHFREVFELFMFSMNLSLFIFKDSFFVLYDAAKYVFGAIADAVSWAIGRIKQYWNDLVGFFRGIPGEIKGAFGNMGNLLYDIGASIIQGLINGVKSMVSSASNAVKDVANGIKDVAKKVLSIFSPSQVFHEIGVNVGQGLINGINSMQDSVKMASANMAGATIQAAGQIGLSGNMNGGTSNAVTTQINGPINIGSQQDADYFFKRLTRNQELANQGMTSIIGSLG